MQKIKCNLFCIIVIIFLPVPLILYWCKIENGSLGLNSNRNAWQCFASYFSGIYGPIVAGIAAYFLIQQNKIAQESLSTSQKSLNTSQKALEMSTESVIFNNLIFQLKTIISNIDYLNKNGEGLPLNDWFISFKSRASELKTIESDYRSSLKTESSRFSVQNILSQAINWFFKGNLDKYERNRQEISKKGESFQKSINETNGFIDTLKNCRLQTVPNTKPEW
jgi:hypothetical protein